MTPEEAIKEFESELKWAELNTYPYVSKQKIEADKMAIKALEQELILDKIKTEIKALFKESVYYISNYDAYKKVLGIINKYKAESEE